jgi:ElaB/YqjD/DUF883 family membrane-anchored ribosome-binding protein
MEQLIREEESMNDAAAETLGYARDKAEQLKNEASAVSRRLSSRFVEYAKKNPPRAVLTALAVGLVVGWVSGGRRSH